MRSRLFIAVTALFVAVAAAPALAAPADTSFIHGYDENIRALIFGVEALDEAESACGNLVSPGGETDLALSGDIATVTPSADETAPPGEDLCELQVVDVTGPNGQINHGTIVSSFVKALKGMELPFNGKGCLVRYIAQSEYGKGDQKVKAGDQSVAGSSEPSAMTSLELAVDEADCVHGKADKAGEDGPGNSKVKAEKSQKDHPGKGQSEGNGRDNGNGQGNGNGQDNGKGQGKDKTGGSKKG